MILIHGTGVSPGLARGPLCFLNRKVPAVERGEGRDPRTEGLRVEQARQTAVEQLRQLAERCREEDRGEAADLFEVHAMMAEDEDFAEGIQALLEEGRTAEFAVQTAGEGLAELFAAMDDPYMRQRAADIRDVARRMVWELLGLREEGPDWAEPVILAADDLAPSETIRLDRSKLLAFATRGGSPNSHTAILARTLGVPAVCGLGEELRDDLAGREVWLDGEEGTLCLDPDEQTLAALTGRLARQEGEREELEALKHQQTVTPDGRRVELCCNIGCVEDVEQVLACGADGIGLFRSEFLFLAADHCPTEEEQFQAYRAVAQAMGGKRVVIRTLDVGADKRVDYLGLREEENPALGLRAIRLCLTRPEMFKTQLRAIYRASAFGKVAVMFPMITAPWEVQECRRLCREAMEELAARGLPFDSELEVGVMIETPAAVLMGEELAWKVDFFSIGTNDLTQYTLACDRQSNDLGFFADPHHPAVLRSIQMAVEAAHRAGIWVGICGELGADLSLLPTFLAMGVDELSVAPGAVLPVRKAVRSTAAGTDF